MKITQITLNHIDAALELVQGHRAAAAKLLDLELKQLNNVVGYYETLRAKWGRRHGRPAKELLFTITPYCRRDAEDALKSVGLSRDIASLADGLPLDDIKNALRLAHKRHFMRIRGNYRRVPPPPLDDDEEEETSGAGPGVPSKP